MIVVILLFDIPDGRRSRMLTLSVGVNLFWLQLFIVIREYFSLAVLEDRNSLAS